MKKHLLLLALPGMFAYMSAANRISSRLAGRNLQIPFEYTHYYAAPAGNICYLRFDPPTADIDAAPPLLLLHDLSPGLSAEEWRTAARLLARRRTVFAPDLPGCGRSERPPLTYTRYLYVQTLQHFLRDVVGAPAVAITSGDSFATAVLADRMDPDAISRIIAVNPPPLSSFRHYPTRSHTLRRDVLQSPILGTRVYNMAFHASGVERRLLRHGFFDPTLLKPAFVKVCYQMAHYDRHPAKHLFAGLCGRYLNLDITESLRLYQKKILFVMGAAEASHRAIYQAYREEIGRTGLLVIGRTAHLPHLERPSFFVQQIEQVLPVR